MCSVSECDKKPYRREMCHAHYQEYLHGRQTDTRVEIHPGYVDVTGDDIVSDRPASDITEFRNVVRFDDYVETEYTYEDIIGELADINERLAGLMSRLIRASQ